MGGKDLSATCNIDAQSVVSSNHSRSALSSSSNSSAHSFSSNISGGSFGCFYLDEPLRRRRRRRRKTIKSTPTHKRPFQCTFCTDPSAQNTTGLDTRKRCICHWRAFLVLLSAPSTPARQMGLIGASSATNSAQQRPILRRTGSRRARRDHRASHLLP